MGQGFQTTLRKIAANTLQLPIENIDYNNPDTSKVVDSGPTAASRSTMIVGKLVEGAAEEMKRRWDEGDITTEVEYEHPEGYLSEAMHTLAGAGVLHVLRLKSINLQTK